MGFNDTDWVSGDWNAVCDICGFNFKASKLKENWKGQRVCKEDFEGRHPQQFVRSRPEKISTDWSRLPDPFNHPVLWFTTSPNYKQVTWFASSTLGTIADWYSA